MKRAVWIALAVLAVAPRAARAEDAKEVDVRFEGEPCRTEQLKGMWDLVALDSAGPVDPDDPYAAQYQRYLFRDNGRFVHHVAGAPLTSADEETMWGEESAATYEVNPRGRVTFRRPDPIAAETCACTRLSKKIGLPKGPALVPGDLALMCDDESGQPTLLRVLRTR